MSDAPRYCKVEGHRAKVFKYYKSGNGWVCQDCERLFKRRYINSDRGKALKSVENARRYLRNKRNILTQQSEYKHSEYGRLTLLLYRVEQVDNRRMTGL